jgi:Ca-activated chloride channel family protein
VSFEAPLWLLSLVVVPLALVCYLLLERRRARFAVSFTNLGVLAGVAERTPAWRRYLPLSLLLLALTVLCIGVARPNVTLPVPEERATVMLVVDTSGSMRAEDVAPTRLDAAREAIHTFLETAPGALRVGIVSFSDEPQVVVPPTRDRELLEQGADLLTPGFGTAIGDAVVRAVEVGKAVTDEEGGEPVAPTTPSEEDGQGQEQPAPLTSILLLSDGAQTRGLVQPLDAAAQAKAANMPVHAIALGTDEGTIEVFRFGELQVIPVPPDRQTLAQMAEATGGRYFDAPDAAELNAVYEELGSNVGRVDKPREATVAFVFGGAALLLAAGVLSGLWLPRLP